MRVSARRGGFTLVELLVVMGILLVLLTTVVAGLRHTTALAHRHETRATMKLCDDLLKEYEAVNGLKNIVGDVGSIQRGSPLKLPAAWVMGQYDLPMYVNPGGAGEVTGSQPQSVLLASDFKGAPYTNVSPAGLAGDMGDKSDPNNPRWASNAVRWSQGVMCILLRDPINRALMAKLPSQRLLENTGPAVNPSGDVVGPPLPPYSIDAALPLDAWGNPIIFVPPGGMHVMADLAGGVHFTDHIIRTSGVYEADKAPPVGPNDYPFFASAGPDGYFTDQTLRYNGASDNCYSCRP